MCWQRLIPEVYRASMLYTLLGLYPFSNYLYSVVGERTMSGYEKIAAFCQKTHIPVALLSMKHWNTSIQRVFSDHGILVYLSGVADPAMRGHLAYARVCTDSFVTNSNGILSIFLRFSLPFSLFSRYNKGYKRGYGGIGRHARFRFWWEPCRFNPVIRTMME